MGSNSKRQKPEVTKLLITLASPATSSDRTCDGEQLNLKSAKQADPWNWQQLALHTPPMFTRRSLLILKLNHRIAANAGRPLPHALHGC